jgi:lipoate---protein ligase
VTSSWEVSHSRASAAEHHGRVVPEGAGRLLWVHEVTRPALVLGSTQDESVVDLGLARALGVEVVRRRSGGGAVLLIPGEVAWLDVVVPAGDPLWDEDVGRSFQWLGHVWQRALVDVGIGGTTVHAGALHCGVWGRLICFAAVGPGELTLAERKVVGISQRRTRTAARFQCAVYRRWDPELLAQLLRLDADAARALRAVAVGVGAHPREIVAAFSAHLPA